METIDYGPFEAQLLQMKATLASSIERLENEMEAMATEDAIDDMEDMASLAGESLSHTAQLKQQRRELSEVMHALAKIKNGTYGTCEVSGNPIEPERLQAEPHTRYCFKHAKAKE